LASASRFYTEPGRIPLTGGFFGKFFVFAAAVENGYIGSLPFLPW
jgi:hypothetical protein